MIFENNALYGERASFRLRFFQDFDIIGADTAVCIPAAVILVSVAKSLLLDLLSEQGIDISRQYMDCGIEIYESEKQHTDAGGSGCGCSAVVLSAYILKKLEEGVWKRVLFVPTGALLSKTSYNEGQTIPGIAHGVVLEHYQG